MGFAREEAQKLGHKHIGTEHILLSLTHKECGISQIFLFNVGIEHEAIYDKAVDMWGTGKSDKNAGQMPFTRNAVNSLELAMEEAASLEHNYIGTEHLLLGLIRNERCKAVMIIKELRGNPIKFREALYELIGSDALHKSDYGDEIHHRDHGAFHKAFETALTIANKLGEKDPKVEHLLLAVLQSGDPLLQAIFKDLNVTYEDVLLRIKKRV